MARDRKRPTLRRCAQFEAVFAQNRKAAGTHFAVLARPNDCNHARLGIVAARKAIRQAVERNRSKRLVREVFRAAAGSLPAVDLVIICRRAVPIERKSTARRELSELVSTIKALCHHQRGRAER